MEPRDSPGTASDVARRFGRFVVAPPPGSEPGAGAGAGKRLALARIGLAGLAGLIALAVLAAVLGLARRSVLDWLAGQPEYQRPFREIVLDPPPPAWFRGGAPVFLDRVRDLGGYPETVSVLGLDLEKLARDFKNYCWVDKVARIERSYPNRLVVRLEYHHPVAEARCKEEANRLLSKDGVILPKQDTTLEAPGRLLWILGLDPPFQPKAGVQWKSLFSTSGKERVDPKVLAATRLADFLRMAGEREGPRSDGARIVAILFDSNDEHTLFVQNAEMTMILWGDAPGAERPDEPAAEAKWTMLRDSVKAQPKLAVKHPDYLMFTKNGLAVYRANP